MDSRQTIYQWSISCVWYALGRCLSSFGCWCPYLIWRIIYNAPRIYNTFRQRESLSLYLSPATQAHGARATGESEGDFGTKCIKCCIMHRNLPLMSTWMESERVSEEESNTRRKTNLLSTGALIFVWSHACWNALCCAGLSSVRAEKIYIKYLSIQKNKPISSRKSSCPVIVQQ